MTTTDISHRATPPSTRPAQLDYILLDGSSSMREEWHTSLAAIETYVSGVARAGVDSRVILHVFDTTDPQWIARNLPISEWKSLISEPIGSHFGMTPLYDAIDLMGQELNRIDPTNASIVIVTDGEEMSSRFADLARAKAVLDWIRAKGWQVTFIGASFDNSAQAKALGADRQSALGVETRKLSSAAAELAKKRARHALYGTEIHFSDDERGRFGGLLGGPEA